MPRKGTCSALDQPHINQPNEQQFHDTTFSFSYVTPACFPAEDGAVPGVNQTCLGKEAGLPITPRALINCPPSHQLFMVCFLETSDSEVQSCQ